MTVSAKRKRTAPVRLSMDLKPQLHYEIKRVALDEDISITQYVTDLIRRDLEDREEKGNQVA